MVAWLLPGRAVADPVATGFAAARPLLARYCLDCHSGDAAQGEVDLALFDDVGSLGRHTRLIQRIEEMVTSGQMPPPDSEQPGEADRRVLADWLGGFLAAEARARAGDPGRVVLRRLNNAEYTHTIRDLTGVEALDPAAEFPADGGAGEGFTNTGQSLVMSPSLATKYLDAAKEVASHAVLLPDGLRFSAGDTPRDFADEALARLKRFYARFTRPLDAAAAAKQTTVQHGITLDTGHEGFLPLEQYIVATLVERERLGGGAEAIAAVARERGLSPKYLGLLWATVAGPADPAPDRAEASRGSMVLDQLRATWRAADPADAAAVCRLVSAWQNVLWTFNPVGLIVRPFGSADGPPAWLEATTPIVDRREFTLKLTPPREAAAITVRLTAGDGGDGGEHDIVVWENPRLVAPGEPDLPLRDVPNVAAGSGADSGDRPAIFGRHPQGLPVEPGDLCIQAPAVITLTIPAELAAGREFVATGRLHSRAASEASVQLEVTAGDGDAAPPAGLTPTLPVVAGQGSAAWARFAAAFAEFRNLFPKALCYGRIVPVDEVVTLNLFYREDDHLRRLMLDDTEAARLDRLWDELIFIAREPLELKDVYEQLVAYASQDRPDLSNRFTPLAPAITGRAEAFRRRLVETEPRQVDAAVSFAGRAFRRPLSPAEDRRLRGLYQTLRAKDLPHEEAIRTLLAHILVAPEFLYKLETAGPGAAPWPVGDHELATRLSYFLWASMPDAELLAAAASGRLHDLEVLKSQTRRMLAAPAARRLAEQFGTQWLHVYGFATLDEKNAELFPEFAGLRADMEEETVRFLDDFFRNDRSILSLLDTDHTFLNESLAKHYGIEGVTGPEWRRVEGVRKHGRGSILGLATTLSTQAGASRTSPILRGNWLSETILGEKLPKPPKDVPQLAETVPEGLSERQLIAMHSENAACAKCHRRIDPFGFALEGFDAIGRLRGTDAAGRPIDAKATLPDGEMLDGQESVRAYLLGPRRDQVVRVFCRKLLGYALGRGVQLSDEPLLDELAATLAANDYRIWVAIEAIVTSPQFRTIRGRDAAEDAT